jgi:hypothetical protein
MTMIDEDWLASALSDLGRAIEVPDDGPAHVLAARGALRRSDRAAASPRRRSLVIGAGLASLAVVVLGVLVVHPTSKSSVTTSAPGVATARSGVADSAKSAPDQVGPPAQVTQGAPDSGLVAGAAPVVGAPSAGAPPVGAPPAGAPAKVVKTGSLDLQVARGRLSPTVDQLTGLASGLGGYVSEAKTAEGSGGPTGDMTMRVPADQFETLLSRTRGLGRSLAVSSSGQDVTGAYVDLDARIHALQDTRAQFVQILSKASAIGDILAVEQQLSTLQTQLEQLQGQQKLLADQASLATLSVHLTEPGSTLAVPPSPPRGLSAAWARARHSFGHGVEAVVGASGGILVFVLCAGLLALAVRLLWPVVRRRLV